MLTIFTKTCNAPKVVCRRNYTASSSSWKFSTKRVFSSVPNVDLGHEKHNFDYDLVVIGGGSGGLACSQEASKEFGKKVAVFDFVKPTPQKTTWGLGGTCVNVGCIPKKLMHQASLLGKSIEDAEHYGWDVKEKPKHDWTRMVSNVQMYIKSLNFGYRSQLRLKGVSYFNEYATFIDPNTIQCTNKSGQTRTVTARRFVIAVGGRPRYLNIPGALEHSITSDDIFSMKKPPGKTLIVGAGYIALETAGFLTGLGFDATVMARSVALRGFDRQMAGLVTEYMSNHGTKFIEDSNPLSIEKIGNQLKVVWKNGRGEEFSDTFDTVLMAIGRVAETGGLGLDKIGVVSDKSSGKIKTTNEQTNIPNIYALGDVINGPELTPVAIKAGRWLAKRLYGKSPEKYQMDYENVPTTVFTPLEYSSIGMTEEQALERLGEAAEVYHSFVQPLEWTLPHHEENACYLKIITNKNDNERLVGIHILSPNSGEILQGFAVALRMGMTKDDLDKTVGIHPTIAEDLVLFRINKRSGEDPKKTGC